MTQRFTLFVDESGDSGIGSLQSADDAKGSTPYMTLRGALIANESLDDVRNTLEQVKTDMNKKVLHCSKLDHHHKLFFIRQLSQHKMTLFGVISNKKTLTKYKEKIEDSNKNTIISALSIS